MDQEQSDNLRARTPSEIAKAGSWACSCVRPRAAPAEVPDPYYGGGLMALSRYWIAEAAVPALLSSHLGRNDHSLILSRTLICSRCNTWGISEQARRLAYVENDAELTRSPLSFLRIRTLPIYIAGRWQQLWSPGPWRVW